MYNKIIEDMQKLKLKIASKTDLDNDFKQFSGLFADLCIEYGNVAQEYYNLEYVEKSKIPTLQSQYIDEGIQTNAALAKSKDKYKDQIRELSEIKGIKVKLEAVIKGYDHFINSTKLFYRLQKDVDRFINDSL